MSQPAPVAAQSAGAAPKGLERLQHIIVVYLENHSFDNLFGTFPRANGLAKAGAADSRSFVTTSGADGRFEVGTDAKAVAVILTASADAGFGQVLAFDRRRLGRLGPGGGRPGR